MGKTTVKTDATSSTQILWQVADEEGSGHEPALVITPYMGVIQIEQEDQVINIAYSAIPDLCKLLKSLKEPS